MKSTIDGTERRGHTGMGLALFCSLAVLVILAGAGCTSDEPNLVGTALVTDHVDTVLFALGAEDVTYYTALRVENPDILVDQQEVLYLGEQAGTRSGALIANFDFSDIFTSDYPEELFTEENIKSVKYSLTKVKFYSAFDDTNVTGKPVNLFYQVQELETPFDPADYANYPVEPVSGIGPFLNSDFGTAKIGNEPTMRFWDAAEFLGWVANRDTVGIIVTFGAQSDSGLVGFASKELTHFSQLEPLAVGTIAAPNFIVEFQDESILNFLLGPEEDTSTFDQVPDAPQSVDDGFLLRTCLRSYPGLYFDLASLPPNAFINRAVLSITNDSSVSFGTLGTIKVLEYDVQRFGDPYRTMELDELNDPSDRFSFVVTGATSLDPVLEETIQFDVTQAILRIINEVYLGTRGFLLTDDEDFYAGIRSTAVNPDFYYREFRFKGTGDANQAHRPQLKITYSVVNDLNGEGE